MLWRVRPTRSPTGAMIGMVAAAWPVPELMGRLMMVCTRNIPMIFTELGSATIALAKALIMVSMIMPSTITVLIVPATPTISAPKVILAMPCTYRSQILLPLNPARIPHTTPSTKNKVAISVINHPK